MYLIGPPTPNEVASLVALFDACGCACHCRWWHFEGTKNEWIERCSLRPEENRAALEAAVLAGDDSARGLVATQGNVVLGWMKLVPRASVPKLRNLPVYRRLDLGPDEGVYSIGCFLVHPEHRHRGIAKLLVHLAKTYVQQWNGRVIEAYPHVIDRAMYDEEAWMGPAKIFTDAGFVPVAGETAYPVLRLVVEPKAG